MNKEISLKIHGETGGLGHTIDQQVELGWLKNGQVKLSPKDAIQKHVSQFWNPQNHPTPQEEERGAAIMQIVEIKNGQPWGKRYEIAATIVDIAKAISIRDVRRLARRAYAEGAKGKPYQKLVQEAVAKKKAEIKSARGGQEYHQEMSW